MAVPVQTIIDRSETTLFDETNVRWPVAELLDYLNAGISAIVAAKPDVYSLSVTHPLTLNNSKQSIPSDGIQFLDLVRVTGGSAIRQVERNHLDHADPDWHLQTGTPKAFIHDPRLPDIFWVWPVPTAATSVELNYAAQPPRVLISDNIPIDDLYENPLHYFTVGMAYAKNTTRGDMNKAGSYFTLFANSIGAKTQIQSLFTPRTPDASAGTNK